MKSHHKSSSEVFQLRMRSVTLPVLHLFESRLELIEKELQEVKTKTPNLFQSSPMILDLEEWSHYRGDLPSLFDLAHLLKRYGILPIGIQGVLPPGYQQEALENQIALFSGARHDKPLTSKSPEIAPAPSTQSIKPSKLITTPIRSGQQVYAEGGDLIVLSLVSSGAELLADGHIHVYGTLRGRALAGVQGDLQARIFCHKLEADLVSIGGYYVLGEGMDWPNKQGAQQVYLDNGKISIHSL